MDIRKITSVADIILTGAAEKPEAEMIVFEGQRVTWQEMKAVSYTHLTLPTIYSV